MRACSVSSPDVVTHPDPLDERDSSISFVGEVTRTVSSHPDPQLSSKPLNVLLSSVKSAATTRPALELSPSNSGYHWTQGHVTEYHRSGLARKYEAEGEHDVLVEPIKK